MARKITPEELIWHAADEAGDILRIIFREGGSPKELTGRIAMQSDCKGYQFFLSHYSLAHGMEITAAIDYAQLIEVRYGDLIAYPKSSRWAEPVAGAPAGHRREYPGIIR